ncbi:MAG: CapA family protein [Patescibacteria group bacterium]
MIKKSKSLLKIILAICLLSTGYFAVKQEIFDAKLPLAQVLQSLPGQTAEEKPTPTPLGVGAPKPTSSPALRQDVGAKSAGVQLIFVGDIMLDREVGAESEKQNDWRWPFLKIADELKEADIVFGNLEGPISDKGEKTDKISSFRMDPKTIEGLNHANFNVLSLANNHALDYGKEALEDTILRLKEAGIDFAPLAKEINGTKFAFLAYTDFCSPAQKTDMENFGLNCLGINYSEILKKDIESAKKSADIVIVSFHYGKEFTQGLSQNQIDFSKAAIDAGADLVVGHHPHVVQKYEIYKDKYIFYSLGNFVFDHNFSKETMQGLMVKIIVKDPEGEPSVPYEAGKKIIEIIPIKTLINNSFQVETAASAALTAPTVSLSSNNLTQGETLLIKINNIKSPDEITGQFDSKEIKFFAASEGGEPRLAGREASGKIFSLVGITAKTTPGNYKLKITFADGNNTEKQIEVAKGNFKVTTLAFTPELEKKGYNATSVAETIATNDGVKIYQAMETTSNTPYFDQSFAYPLAKITNVGAFGSIRKSGEISLQHLGADLDADMNTPVYAVNDGAVTGVLDLINYGNTIVIDHGLGIFSLYLHLDKFKVAVGQKVKNGEIVGLSGNTGYSIAPHLHFSVKANGASVDPLKFIEAAKF